VSDTAFVTGGRGFAGSHLVPLLRAGGSEPVAPGSDEVELCDGAAVRAAVAAAAPAVVFHLAAFASPSRSWEVPAESVLDNLAMTINVLEGVRHEAPEAAVVIVTTGQVYGDDAPAPVTEDAPLSPTTPYGVSKAACDMLAARYSDGYGMHIVCARPFNHAGPGQSADYVVSSIARQIAVAEAADAPEAVVRTGDVSSARDFTDVRDVVRAYSLAARAPAAPYNVCSGRSTTIADLIEIYRQHSRLPVRQETDPGLLRTHDARPVHGSAERLREATGWEPEISLSQTAADTLAWWREKIAAGL
jgi:GDP-4-dehydro-6-deoxy-D-mannose reductase